MRKIAQEMSDIFISYSSENREHIKPLVNALKQNGWSVWWDRKIPIGKRYDEVILQELEESKCVVVVWTKASVVSDYVHDEVTRATDQNKLFPIRLEEVNPPFGFGKLQVANLVDWDGTDSHKEFARLVQALQKKCPRVTPTDPAQEDNPPPPFPPKTWPLLVLVILPILIGLLLRFMPMNSAEVIIQAAVTEFNFVSTTEQSLSNPLRLVGVYADGLSEVSIPGNSISPQVSLTRKEGMIGRLVITSSSNGDARGGVTLDTVTLPAGILLRLIKDSDPSQYSLNFLQQAPQSIKINVRGPVDINVPGIGKKSRLFSFPQTVVLEYEPDSLLQFTVLEPVPEHLLPRSLSVTSLSFTGDKPLGEDPLLKHIGSTILNGNFLLNGTPQHLASGEYLTFEHSEGTLDMVQLNQENLEVEFHGQVQGMKRCQGKTQCISLMPSHWDALLKEYSTLIMVGSIIYFGLIAVGGLRWWKGKSKKSNSRQHVSA